MSDFRRAMYGDGALNRVEVTGEHLHKLTLRCPGLERLSFTGVRMRTWGRPEFKSLEMLRIEYCDCAPDMFREERGNIPSAIIF